MTRLETETMETDKRQSVRKRTDQLVYAEFGPENGSILLNLSEAGCSFQSMAPVREEQLRFWVSVGDGRKLEGEGRMVWSDIAKKTGGLRFLNPSQELREQVQAWLEQTLVTTDGKLDPVAMESEAKRRRKKLREEARAEAERPSQEDAQKEKRAGDGGSQMRPSDAPTANEVPQMIRWDDSTLRVDPGKSGALVRGIGAITLTIALFAGLVTYRRELGHLVVSVGSTIAGEKGAPKEGDTAVPAQPDRAQESASPEVKPVAMPEASSEGVADSADTAKQQSTSVSTGPAKRGAAQPEGVEEDVPSLWTSVENGDTRAEVVLASRYTRGDGVPQSCAQARVLLEAAVKRGSSEAKQKLEELGQAGCP